MEVNLQKMKPMSSGKDGISMNTRDEGENLETVAGFRYMRSITLWKLKAKGALQKRTETGEGPKPKPVWNDNNGYNQANTPPSHLHLTRETCTLTAELQKIMKMRCSREGFHILYKERISNKVVKKKNQDN